MKGLKISYCTVERKACINGWINDWFKDCLCNLKDEISFVFGVFGLFFWAVAEIPQIITNFNNKSASAVSLAFLSTWIIGDIFNLVGCILEPATLPTQFYTAVLYTTVTIILALQCVYYNHFLQWWKSSHKEAKTVKDEVDSLEPGLQDPLITTTTMTTNVPVEVPRTTDFYFMSARSLAGSETPPRQHYIKARSGPPALEHDSSDSSSEQDEPLITQPRAIPRTVRYGLFVSASANLPQLSRALRRVHSVEFPGSRLSQEYENAYGQWLGWLMAVIYMGGRIPQIWLNIKRGNVEGLNPLMFVFALLANATYVGSILVRSSEWELIKPNMPWLLDAAVCVLLDLFIILQYIYYKYIKLKKREHCGE
ncbi:hypothetical protein ABFS82_03G054200 [Erythranthe guttata]